METWEVLPAHMWGGDKLDLEVRWIRNELVYELRRVLHFAYHEIFPYSQV